MFASSRRSLRNHLQWHSVNHYRDVSATRLKVCLSYHHLLQANLHETLAMPPPRHGQQHRHFADHRRDRESEIRDFTSPSKPFSFPAYTPPAHGSIFDGADSPTTGCCPLSVVTGMSARQKQCESCTQVHLKARQLHASNGHMQAMQAMSAPVQMTAEPPCSPTARRRAPAVPGIQRCLLLPSTDTAAS